MMNRGLFVFSSLTAALRAGFQVLDSDPEGYVVRRRGPAGWEMALVRPGCW